MIINPYIPGNPVGNHPTFIGRDKLLGKILTVVQNNSLVLYGQRRIGKTSVLQVLETQLSEKEAYLPVSLDFENKAQQPVAELLGELAYKISDQLNQTTPNLGAEPSSTFFQWLSEILDHLPADKSKLVLLFDEFDVLADPESEQAGARFFPELQKLLNINQDRLNVIFVIGRKVEELSNVTMSLFGNIPTQQVSLLKHDDTIKLVRFSETHKSLYWSTDAVDEVWRLTSGHPYFTQCLCSHIWERLCPQDADEPPTVTLKDVQEAIPDTLIFSRMILESLWRSLPSAAQVVASALAEADLKGMSKADLDNLLSQVVVQKVIRELNEAPKLLKDWDIIEDSNGRYRFRVELIRCWIAESKSFHQLLDSNLINAHPEADKLYRQAQELYEDQFLNEAAVLLRSALKKFSAHVKANQLLADILIEQKDYSEARNILEKFFNLHKDAARSRLIQTLLLLAKSNDNQDEQLKLYERILAIDPKHPEAKRQKHKIINNQQEKKRKWIETITGIYKKYSKRMWEFLAVILAFLVSYYWLTDRIPTKPLIVLEVEQATDNVPEYTITGVVSDKPYFLDTVKIYPKSDQVVKQAKFQYDIYPKHIDLTKSSGESLYYEMSKEFLQKELGEDANFSYKFLDEGRFTFYFQFEASEIPAEFNCIIFTADNDTADNNNEVECQVREKGYLSLFRGIPWFGTGIILSIILIILIEIVYAFKERNARAHQKY